MRRNLSLFAAFVCAVVLVSAATRSHAAAATEDSSIPHIGDVCTNLGTTTLSDDRKDIAACLKTDETYKNGKAILRWKGTSNPGNCQATIDKCQAAMRAQKLKGLPYAPTKFKQLKAAVGLANGGIPAECMLTGNISFPIGSVNPPAYTAFQFVDAVNKNCGWYLTQAASYDCDNPVQEDVRGSVVCTVDDTLACTLDAPRVSYSRGMSCNEGGK